MTYNIDIPDSILIEVSNDSVRQTGLATGYLVSSKFEQSNDSVALRDYAGPYKCPFPDTGWYKFSIVGDSAIITLLVDSCLPRGQAYDGQKLTRLYLGVESKQESINDISIYPNPSEGAVNINLSEPGKITIVNQAGQVVYRNESSRDLQFHLSFSSGMYVVLYEGKKRSQTQRFTVL